jgi:pimeloyl-ACP methyl ester carboxylesterase
MPDARLVELENVGHGSVLMQPDLCTEVLLNFVRHYV